jgi:hypothetical protein
MLVLFMLRLDVSWDAGFDWNPFVISRCELDQRYKRTSNSILSLHIDLDISSLRGVYLTYTHMAVDTHINSNHH